MDDWQQTTLGDPQTRVCREVAVPRQGARTLPSEWRQVPLSEVVTRVTTKNVDGINENVLTVSAEYGLIAQESFFTKKVASKDTSGYYVVAPGQFVYNKSTSKSAAYGTVARNLSNVPGIVSPLYFVFEAKDGAALPEYLELALNSTQFFGSLAGMLREGARSHGLLNVRLKEFYAATVMLPPLPVQERIVEIIGAVDDHIAALAREAIATETSAGVVADSILADHTNVRVGNHLLRIEGGRSPQAIDRPPTEVEEGVLKVSAVTAFQFNPNESKALAPGTKMPTSAEVQAGDVLVTRANGAINRVGAVCRVPSNVRGGLYLSDKTLRLVPADDLDRDFLVVAMALSGVRKQIAIAASGSASMKNISQSKIASLEVPVPELAEQRKIAETVLAMRSFGAASRAEAERLRQVRAALLSGLLNRTIDIASARSEV